LLFSFIKNIIDYRKRFKTGKFTTTMSPV